MFTCKSCGEEYELTDIGRFCVDCFDAEDYEETRICKLCKHCADKSC